MYRHLRVEGGPIVPDRLGGGLAPGFARLHRYPSPIVQPGKALITGGAGFIGSHLAELLLDDGWEVYVLDDVSTGSMENLARLSDRPELHLVYNLIVFIPMIVAMWLHTRPSQDAVNDCTCAAPPVPKATAGLASA